MDRCHIHMFHRTVAWTSDVTYVGVMEQRGLNPVWLTLFFFLFFANGKKGKIGANLPTAEG